MPGLTRSARSPNGLERQSKATVAPTVPMLSRLLPLRRYAAILAASVCLALSPLAAHGQEPPPPDEQESASTPTPAAVDELSTASVKQTIADLEQADTGIEESLRTRLLDLYRTSLDRLQLAESEKAKAEEFESLRINAPERLEAIKSELATPVPEPRPEPPPDASTQQLEQLLAQREAELKTAQAELAKIDAERQSRAERRQKIPEATAAARQRLEEANAELNEIPPADQPERVTVAKRIAAEAKKRAAEAELAAYEAEIRSYDARGESITARRDLAARKVAIQEGLVRAWRDVVNEKRRMEAAAAAEAAQAERRALARKHAVVKRLADENLELAEFRKQEGLADRLQATARQLEVIENLRSKNEEEFKRVQNRVEIAGLSQEMGQILRKRLEGLPDTRDHLRAVEARQKALLDIEIALLQREEQRSDLDNIEALTREAMVEVNDVSDELRREIEQSVVGLLTTRRDYLDGLINDYKAYEGALSAVNQVERELIHEVDAFADYIRERILWVPSAGLPNHSDVGTVADALSWLLNPVQWASVVQTAWTATLDRPVPVLFAVLIVLGLAWLRTRFVRSIREIGGSAQKSTAHVFAPTLRVFFMTLVVAAVWPFAVWLAGWRLLSVQDPTSFDKAIGSALQSVALVYLLLSFVRHALRPDGLCESHFSWPTRSIRIVRRRLWWFQIVGLPLMFAIVATEWSEHEEFQSSLGRLAFIFVNLFFALNALRVLRPQGPLMRDAAIARSNFVSRFRGLWLMLGVGIPTALSLLAFLGYYYSAMHLADRVYATNWILITVLFLDSLALRWLLVSRRRIAIEQMHKRREAAQAEDGEKAEEVKEPELDISSISAQTRQLLRAAIVTGLLIAIGFVWTDIFPALRKLDDVRLWSGASALTVLPDTTPESASEESKDSTESSTDVERKAEEAVAQASRPAVIVTLADVMLAVVTLIITIILAKNFPGLLEIALLQRLPLAAAQRFAITTVCRYVIVVVGIVIAFGAIGIGWSKVQWLVAAMTVGLGFGLQEIFANFVSGLIILFERPIRIGDIVTVGGVHGTVTRIQIRATTILDWDRRELLVPNKEFITGQMINWTLSDPVTREVITVGIAYGSDTDQATEILLKIARQNPDVLDEPAPFVVFQEFGDSALILTLRVYLPTRSVWAVLIHSLHSAIHEEFKAAGIEIAFPQRDVHVRSIEEALPIRNAPTDESPESRKPE